MAKFPRIEFIEIDGRQVPIVQPQHYVGNGDETAKTGEENPLPTKDEDVKEELASIKATQQEILDRLDGTFDTKLTGNNVEEENALPTQTINKQEIEVLVDSDVIGADSSSGNIYMYPKGASEIYLFIQIDQQPWSLDYRNQFGSVSSVNGYPNLSEVDETYRRSAPALSFPLGYNPGQGIPSPNTLKEAKDWGLPITSSEYFRLRNQSDDDATVTISILRVWR